MNKIESRFAQSPEAIAPFVYPNLRVSTCHVFWPSAVEQAPLLAASCQSFSSSSAAPLLPAGTLRLFSTGSALSSSGTLNLIIILEVLNRLQCVRAKLQVLFFFPLIGVQSVSLSLRSRVLFPRKRRGWPVESIERALTNTSRHFCLGLCRRRLSLLRLFIFLCRPSTAPPLFSHFVFPHFYLFGVLFTSVVSHSVRN